jgi:hypothetical protein
MLLLPSASEPGDSDLDCGVSIAWGSSSSGRACTDMNCFPSEIEDLAMVRIIARVELRVCTISCTKSYNHLKNNTVELEDKQNHIFSHCCQSSRMIDNNTQAVFCFLSLRL